VGPDISAISALAYHDALMLVVQAYIELTMIVRRGGARRGQKNFKSPYGSISAIHNHCTLVRGHLDQVSVA
jgi:hypothetical protein